MRLGILGSGQLGAMLALAARRLGVDTHVFAPDPGPATAVAARSTIADWGDAAALAAFAADVDHATCEIEHVPPPAAAALGERVALRPSVVALAAAGDRWRERLLLAALGIPHAPWARADGPEDLGAVARTVGFPCLLKRRLAGYDGRGQARVDGPEAFAPALAALGGPAIAERVVPWRREVSLLVARGADGALAWYDPVENQHRDGILRTSCAPAPALSAADRERLRGWARALLEALDYVGLLTIELFETDAGWLVNEIAPRVHNSGHWTIEGAETSQFENHVRAVLGWPLGSAARRAPAALVNLIGALPPLEPLLRVPGAALHLYGKAPRPGRKLGHVTVVAPSDAALADRLEALVALVPGGTPRAGARRPGRSEAGVAASAPRPPGASDL